MTAGSASEQAKCHVSEVKVQVNHFVNEALSNVQRGETVRWIEPDYSEQTTDTPAA